MEDSEKYAAPPKGAELVSAPHGAQQNIKMNLLQWLNEGRDPFEIIIELAQYLETISAEPGFADIVKGNINSVYGEGFGQPKVLSSELLAVRTRLARLKQSLTEVSDVETQTRLKFAIEHHEKRIIALEKKLHHQDDKQ